MKNHLKNFLLFLGLMLISNSSLAHSPVWPGKQLSQVLPEATTFEKKQAVMTPAQVVWFENNLGESIRTEDRNPLFYVGVNQSQVVGTVIFIDALGVNGDIEMGMAINQNGEVMKVVLFEHSEGASLSQDLFLKQFEGKKAPHKFKVGADVVSPKGSEKSAQIIATAVRRGLLLGLATLRLGEK